MAARQKAKGATTLQSWEEADNALKEIGELTRYIEDEEARATERIQEEKETLKSRTIEQLARKKALLHDLEEFAKINKDRLLEETKGKKSIDLTHGRLGFRKSSKIVCPKGMIGKIAEKLASVPGLKSFVRVKSELDKEEIGKLSDKDLERRLGKYGITRDTSDEFWCESAVITAKTLPGAA